MTEPPLTVARYIAASQGPPRTVALPVAEKVSEALQSLSDGAEVFTGKSADGTPLAGHRHASIFCEAGGGNGRIRNVTVHAPMGFDDRALDALSRLVKVWSERGGGRSTPWHAFRTVRAGGAGRRSTAAGYGFHLAFAEPVWGPIAVGYGAHFGLGTFTPADGRGPAAEPRS
jgi:hypothetical protein